MFRAGLEAYLDATDRYDEIRVLLCNHGTESIGLASAEDWQRTAARARKIGVLTGTEASVYPRDFASLVRTLCPLPLPLAAEDAAAALNAHDEIIWHPTN